MYKLTELPATQCAVELVGADKMVLNQAKAVDKPGPYQLLCRVEAVGLCFSDMKLLKQFSTHGRKGQVISGIAPEVLEQINSYRPDEQPTVPGHETVCTIVAAGDKVQQHHIGQRVMVQTDYRWLKTAGSNAAFGYNFEGALQQYVLLDERVFVDPDGQSLLVPVDEGLSHSAVALVEPWACVEDSYVNRERQSILDGSRLLVAADSDRDIIGLEGARPGPVTIWCQDRAQAEAIKGLFGDVREIESLDKANDQAFDDIVYFGRDKDVIEKLNDKLAARGIINIVLGGSRIAGDVSVDVGRCHYGMTRWTGTLGNNAMDSYENIPAAGEIRPGDRALVVGAGGPMGQMHVIRLICSSVEGLTVVGTDFDDDRLDNLMQKAGPLAKQRAVKLELVNPNRQKIAGSFSYISIMAPVAELVRQAVAQSGRAGIVNVFAGIPAGVRCRIDLNKYIENGCFMFGTSGSDLSDMLIVLDKLSKGLIDTNSSVGAVSGMAGAIDGMEAVRARTIDGKIVVYPALEQLPLVRLSDIGRLYPSVGEKLSNGQWTAEAEKQLLKVAKER